ncbi:uncharacterized protein HKW66_Vig0180160 [Vigna angularis]|uniref:Uncharacterized protein n=1 Tax=Phaseolus angularis TaxID=3914 RepID=A0A8T0K4W0_PHAAN|nr:uncharacterized protein HKW66_Vig0180160 [Vigna angularis]
MGVAEANTALQAPSKATSDSVEALLDAVRYNDMDDVKSLEANGVPLDSKDDQGRTDEDNLVEVGEGEDASRGGVVAPIDDLEVPPIVDDDEALHMAAANGHVDIVEYLIIKGVSEPLVDCYSRSRRFLSDIKSYRWPLPTYSLSKSDLNAPNEEKNTPLHWACLNGHVEVVKKLILAGANVSVLNRHERTPMDEAVSRGKLEVMDATNEAVALVELRGAMVSEQET